MFCPAGLSAAVLLAAAGALSGMLLPLGAAEAAPTAALPAALALARMLLPAEADGAVQGTLPLDEGLLPASPSRAASWAGLLADCPKAAPTWQNYMFKQAKC